MTHKEWKAEVVKRLAVANKSRAELAEDLGYSINYVQHIICGDMKAKKAVRRISDALGIQPYSE